MTFTSAVVFDGGVYRWTTNNAVPPQDCYAAYGIDTLPGFDAELQRSTREAEDAAFLASYRERMKNHVPGAQERAEMLAAFGPGATVVNVLTGQEIRL